MERRYEEALHLIRADLWNDAHTVIMQHVAIDAIIEGLCVVNSFF